MAFLKDVSKFKELQKKLNEQKNNRGGGFDDSRYIKFKAGNTYKFRLIPYIPDDSDRDMPFLVKYKHMLREDDKWHGVTCPTTFFPKTGFDKCPLCANNRKLWNSGLESDKELYRKFKRRFDGYALVYVVNDPTNEENNGTVKVMRYGISIHKFLQKEILGLVDDAESLNEDAIGLDAFNFDKGYDLIIEVTQKGEWNDYGLKFARNATAIDVDMNQLEEDCKALDIDSEVKESSEEDLQKYFNRFVLDIDGDSADVSIEADTPAPPKKSNDVSDDVMNLMDDLNMNGDTEESSDSSDDSSDDNTLDEIQDLLADLDA